MEHNLFHALYINKNAGTPFHLVDWWDWALGSCSCGPWWKPGWLTPATSNCYVLLSLLLKWLQPVQLQWGTWDVELQLQVMSFHPGSMDDNSTGILEGGHPKALPMVLWKLKPWSIFTKNPVEFGPKYKNEIVYTCIYKLRYKNRFESYQRLLKQT